jgi:hypothetical protein
MENHFTCVQTAAVGNAGQVFEGLRARAFFSSLKEKVMSRHPKISPHFVNHVWGIKLSKYMLRKLPQEGN